MEHGRKGPTGRRWLLRLCSQRTPRDSDEAQGAPLTHSRINFLIPMDPEATWPRAGRHKQGQWEQERKWVPGIRHLSPNRQILFKHLSPAFPVGTSGLWFTIRVPEKLPVCSHLYGLQLDMQSDKIPSLGCFGKVWWVRQWGYRLSGYRGGYWSFTIMKRSQVTFMLCVYTKESGWKDEDWHFPVSAV